ncbi:MAG: hypothetical protein QXP70_05140 [Methanomassiliicoccales archaeon]
MREAAIRIFAAEFNSSNLEHREDEEKGSVYIVTPLGAMANRVFITGVLTDVSELQGEEGSMLRATVSDATGDFKISAGQYQEMARKKLKELQTPTLVAAVGKARGYRPEEGTFFPFIRLEAITAVDKKQREFWTYETCRETLRRINAISAAFDLQNVDIPSLLHLGIDKKRAQGIALAIAHYGRTDLERYRAAVMDALRQIPGTEIRQEEAGEELSKAELIILEIIGEKDAHHRGADWNEVVQEAIQRQLTQDDVKAAAESLMDRGMIYEPSLGRMKRI